MSVLEQTDIEILDETWLDADLPCPFTDAGAAWRWTMVCCGEHADLCEHHDLVGVIDARQRLSSNFAFHVCAACAHSFGFNPHFDEVYTRMPI